MVGALIIAGLTMAAIIRVAEEIHIRNLPGLGVNP
jgi:hypothetical protein